MAYKIKNKKVKEKKIRKEQINNSYVVEGKDMSKVPIYYLEGDYGLTPEQERMLWQYGVDTGIVWRLKGWYGRTAQDLLNSGEIKYPRKHKSVYSEFSSSTDFYGNPIPTHEEAKKRGLYKK